VRVEFLIYCCYVKIKKKELWKYKMKKKYIINKRGEQNVSNITVKPGED
jgi:hypothetical protein